MAELCFLGLIALSYAALYLAAIKGTEALLVLVAMITIIGNVTVGKIVTLAGIQTSPTAGLAVCLFWAGSLLTQYDGLRAARRALYVNFASLFFLTACGALVMRMGSGNAPPMDQAMDALFGLMPHILLGACASFGAAYLFTMHVQRRVQRRFKGCTPWPAQAAIVAVANLIDITIFCVIAFYDTPIVISEVILMTWATRLFALMLGLPVILAIRRWHKRCRVPARPDA